MTEPAELARRSEAALAALQQTAERARDYAQSAKAPSTRRAYAADLRDFAQWCDARGIEAWPAAPQTVALYFTDLAEHAKPATIRRRAVAIAQNHKRSGLESPVAHPAVREVLAGIARTKAVAQSRKDALDLQRLKDVLLAIGEGTLPATRDRAIVLLGFWGGFRRSEIAALDVQDVRFEKAGAVVTLRRSKTDQRGEGREIALPALEVRALCPVHALRAWLHAADLLDGALFRSFGLDGSLQPRRISGRDVARLVQRVAKRARLDGNFGAHSLRAGFVTSAAAAGVPEADIQRVTGHRSVAILRGYVRRATLFEGAAQLRMLDGSS